MKQTDSILFKSGSWNCLTRGCIYANLWGKNVLATFEYKTESWGGGYVVRWRYLSEHMKYNIFELSWQGIRGP